MTTLEIIAMLRDESAPVNIDAVIDYIQTQEALVQKVMGAMGLQSVDQLQEIDSRLNLSAENERLKGELSAYRERFINRIAGQMELLGKDSGAIDRFKRRATAMDFDQLDDEAESVAERLRERFKAPRLTRPSDGFSAGALGADLRGFRV
jgi:hypothetical protein